MVLNSCPPFAGSLNTIKTYCWSFVILSGTCHGRPHKCAIYQQNGNEFLDLEATVEKHQKLAKVTHINGTEMSKEYTQIQTCQPPKLKNLDI